MTEQRRNPGSADPIAWGADAVARKAVLLQHEKGIVGRALRILAPWEGPNGSRDYAIQLDNEHTFLLRPESFIEITPAAVMIYEGAEQTINQAMQHLMVVARERGVDFQVFATILSSVLERDAGVLRQVARNIKQEKTHEADVGGGSEVSVTAAGTPGNGGDPGDG